MDYRTPPSNLETERALLGACLQNNKAIILAVDALNPEDFYSEVHRRIFLAIESFATTPEVDHVLVRNEIRKMPELKALGGDVLLMELISELPNVGNTPHYIKILKRYSRLRRAIDIASSVVEEAFTEQGEPDEILGRGMMKMEEVLRGETESDTVHVSEPAAGIDQWLRDLKESKGITGIRTGIARLDRALGGLKPRRLIVIGARPQVGKSLLAGQIAFTVARQGYKVLVVSPEMDPEDYVRRFAVAAAGVDASKVTDGKATKDEEDAIRAQAEIAAGFRIHIAPKARQRVSDIRRRIARIKPDLVVIDYLQQLTPEDKSVPRHEQVMNMSAEINAFKKDFNIPVIACAQLNRGVEGRGADARPVNSDLKDSGALEQDADAIALLHKDDKNPMEREFLLSKNRHGETARGILHLGPGLWIDDQRRWIDDVRENY